MSKIYQGEDDSVVVIEEVRGKIYLSDDLDDSIITICPKSWPQIKETIDKKLSSISDGDYAK